MRELERVRVLAVDDHADTRLVLKTTLESRGAVVDSVGSVEEALHDVDDFLPDVIVSDLLMPGETGFDLVRRLHGEAGRGPGSKIPVVAVTALPGRAIRQQAMASGFAAFLVKPFAVKDLVGVVRGLAQEAP